MKVRVLVRARPARDLRFRLRSKIAFSKNQKNHIHALSIHFMQYNFVRLHQAIRCSTAMEAGATDPLWSLEEMVEIEDEWEASQKDEA
jgi:hypothetical protein